MTSHRVNRIIFSITRIALSSLLFSHVHAQEQAESARERAPIDITGYWVSLVTDDWLFRMVIPPRGDPGAIPVNEAGRRVTNEWDPERDKEEGEACKAYAAPSIMRLPTRLRISWEDDNTLRVETDTGTQTRLFHFDEPEPTGEKTWQGHSVAKWLKEGEQFEGGGGSGVPSGSLQVDTTHLRAGYLRKNGVPYSENAFLREYFGVIEEEDGNRYLIVETFVDDPTYLRVPFVRTSQFKKEPDGSGWLPTPCGSGEWLFE